MMLFKKNSNWIRVTVSISIMKSNNGRVVYQKETKDFQTGEVVQIEREIQIPKEPDFVKLYLNDLVLLKEVPQWVSGILYSLLKHMNYQNEIVLNSSIKKRIAADLGIIPKTIDNALVTFVKKSILMRQELGVYKANPYLFGKGDWNNIRKIRLQVEYGNDVRNIQAEITKEVPDNSPDLI
ncbi:MAG: hypothetical protein EOP45_07395, partial [Sphingobacteriaceae bacterium]